MPDAVAKALPVIRARCEELGRDPAGLRVAVHLWGEPAAVAPGRRGSSGSGSTPASASTGVLQGFPAVRRPDHRDALVEDCAAVGLLEPEPAR